MLTHLILSTFIYLYLITKINYFKINLKSEDKFAILSNLSCNIIFILMNFDNKFVIL